MIDRRLARLGAALSFLVSLLALRPLEARSGSQAPVAVAEAPACSKIWLGREAEIEELMRTSEVTKIVDVPIGVTKPKRAFVREGPPFQSMAWKPLRPGLYSGYWESYKSEIAAWEIDKLVGLGMVPPAVERRLQSDLGAVILWVENVKGWSIKEPARGPDLEAWNRQVSKMKMFDQLIGNIDRNQGNLLYDGEYHLILIDHSRAFTGEKNLNRMAKPTRIDRELWEKMSALTLEQLQPALGRLIGKGEIRAIIERRDRMRRAIEALVAEKGEATVFYP
ncbi:MAG: hypothetical protein A2V74_07785 [Acidobacteria bacterium RBG_16_70_10]|nr:MAG: hypothetical protein A2V74_07785 [Acidobacteria bacterium RBG_16_70_10]